MPQNRWFVKTVVMALAAVVVEVTIVKATARVHVRGLVKVLVVVVLVAKERVREVACMVVEVVMSTNIIKRNSTHK